MQSGRGEAATIFLIRHGRTSLNAAGALRGHLDPPLDEVGVEEAARLGELFDRVSLAAVVSSPLARALQTAEAVAAPHRLAVDVEAELIDRDYGRWAGRSLSEVAAEVGSLDAAPGVEPIDRLQARVCAALSRIAERALPGASVAVVTHDAVNRVLVANAAPAQFSSVDDVPQGTGCWNRLEIGAGEWRVLVVDARPGDGLRP